MADYSTLIEYDRPHTVVVLNPVNGEDDGIRVNVVSRDSKRVVNALREAQSKWFAEVAANKDGDAVPERPDNERIILVNCIDSWDWAGESFGHISGSGKPSLEDREFIVDHPNAKFFTDAITVGTVFVENFTQKSPEIAADMSS